MVRIKSPKDFWAGLLFIGIGLFFIIGAGNYELGRAARMGPAYFPTMVGGLLALIGAVVFFQSFVVRGGKVAAFPLRLILFMTVALLLFGYLLKPLGLVAALTLLVVVSAFAGHEFKLREALVLAFALIVLSVLVFVKGLGQPFPLWPSFFS
ncbi:MAG: tripartite tricarboxylate transporter TctB family protein [Syntrophales bacterium]